MKRRVVGFKRAPLVSFLYVKMHLLDLNLHRNNALTHRVNVNAGGDEDALSLFYDNDLNLLAIFHHNQTPDIRFFCGETGDTKDQLEPFPECMDSVLFSTPKKSSTPPDDTLSGGDTLENIEAMNVLGIGDIGNDFFDTYEMELDPDTKVDFEYSHYKADFSDEVRVLTLFWVEDTHHLYRLFRF